MGEVLVSLRALQSGAISPHSGYVNHPHFQDPHPNPPSSTQIPKLSIEVSGVWGTYLLLPVACLSALTIEKLASKRWLPETLTQTLNCLIVVGTLGWPMSVAWWHPER